MASRSLGTLTLDLVARVGGFAKGMSQAERISEQRMKAITRQAKQLGKEIGIAFTAAATATAYAIKSAIDRADEVYNAAQKIGITSEALSGLEYAAKQAGVGMEELQAGLAKLVKFQSAAAQGNDTAVATFQAFGIALKDSNGQLRDSEAVLKDWADVFQSLPDGATKTALAMRVFGKSGAELIPFLNEGRRGIAELTAEAERLGLVISTDTGRKADQFNDQIDKLKATFTGAATQLATEYLPKLIELAEDLQKGLEKGSDMRGVIDGLATVFKVVGGAIEVVDTLVRALTNTFAFSIIQAQNYYAVLYGISTLDFKGAAEAAKRAGQGFADFQGAQDQLRHDLLDDGGGGNGAKPHSRPRQRKFGVGRSGSQATEASATHLLATEHDKEKKSNDAASEAKRRAAEAARRQAEAERDLAEKIAKVAEANRDFTMQLEDLRDDMAGPQAEAKREYERGLAALAELHKAGERPVSELREAENLLAEAYAKTTAEIEKRLNPGAQVLADLQFQIDLTNMATQAERDRAVFLRDNINATDAQADAYARMNAQLDETREQIAIADGFRSHWEDAFSSILDGSKSAKEAFGDLATSILADMARMLAQKWVEKLFGGFGTQLGGGGGGGGSGILGGILGLFGGGGGSGASAGGGMLDWISGGYAAGGRPPVGQPYWVGENGPELRVDDRPGTIIPAGQSARMAAGNKLHQTNHFNFAGPVDRRTRHQLEQDTYKAARRALRTVSE